MRVYRSVCTYIWNDDKFPFSSDDCQLVWFHIFTNPASSPLGVFRASLAGLAEDKNRNGSWTYARYVEGFQEALLLGFLKLDSKALLISFPKYFSPANICNHPQSPNVVTSWGERFHDLPNSPLKRECYQSLKALLEGKGKAFQEAFMKAFGEVYPHHSPNTDPDSLFLTPDSLFLTPEPEQKKKKKIKSCKADKPFASENTLPTWKAYEEAYRSRYGVLPIRNVKVNSCLKSFMSRVPEEEAPDIASFYVRHPGAYYVSRGHPIELLLRDAEKIRTEWASNRPITQRQAQQSDGQAARGQVWKELIDEAEAKKGTA